MMERRGFKYVCQVDTVYSLFLYLLLFPQNIEKTFYIFGSGIPNVIKEKFINNSFVLKKKQGGFLYSLLNIIYRGRILLPYIYWKYNLKNKVSYGQDHLIFSKYVIRKSLYFNLLEDGTANYEAVGKLVEYRKNRYLQWKITSLLNCLRGVISMPWGFHPKIRRIFLSGILNIPPYNYEKIELFSLQEQWKKLSAKNKEIILRLLCVYNVFEEGESYDILLLTQCFSEDQILSENDKIQMYKDILHIYQEKQLKICLKSHPREKTNYVNIFPFVKIIPSYMPFELLTLIGDIPFKKAITINSTAIYCLKKDIDKIVLGANFLEKYNCHS